MEAKIIQTLRATLSERGLSLAQVATDAGISKEGLRLILLGKRSPSLATLCAVAGVLGMEIKIQKQTKMKKSTTFFCGEYGEFGFLGTKDAFGYTCTSEKLCTDQEGNPFMRLHWRK